MDKPIKVKLEKNQMVVTEAQYTVATHFIRRNNVKRSQYDVEVTNEHRLEIKTVRATSSREAEAIVLNNTRKELVGWSIHGYVVEKTGE